MTEANLVPGEEWREIREAGREKSALLLDVLRLFLQTFTLEVVCNVSSCFY